MKALLTLLAFSILLASPALASDRPFSRTDCTPLHFKGFGPNGKYNKLETAFEDAEKIFGVRPVYDAPISWAFNKFVDRPIDWLRILPEQAEKIDLNYLGIRVKDINLIYWEGQLAELYIGFEKQPNGVLESYERFRWGLTKEFGMDGGDRTMHRITGKAFGFWTTYDSYNRLEWVNDCGEKILLLPKDEFSTSGLILRVIDEEVVDEIERPLSNRGHKWDKESPVGKWLDEHKKKNTWVPPELMLEKGAVIQ